MNSITSNVVELLLSVTHRFVPDGMVAGVAQLAFGDYSVGGFTLWMSLLAFAGRNTAAKLDSDIKAALTSTESRVPFYENDGWR